MPLVHAQAITKSYGGVRALAGVDLVVNAGEVLGLVGENGSGKSSLLKIVGGRTAPSSGTIAVDGRIVPLRSPADALAQGIALAAQEVVVHRDLTIAENLFVGMLPHRFGIIQKARLRREATAILRGLGLDLDSSARLGSLSLQYQQIVGIAKMVARRPRVLLLDEPTSTLGPDDVSVMHRTVRRLAAEGIGIVYITHRMDEYFAVADRVTVLRDGCVVSTRPIAETSERDLVADMVGRDLGAFRRRQRRVQTDQPPVLDIRGLTAEPKLHDVSLSIGPGEIVGLAGQAGSGRSTLLRTLFGGGRPRAGAIVVAGRPLTRRGIAAAMASGLGFVPEDRKRSGLVMQMSVRENLTMTHWRTLSRLGLFRREAERTLVNELVRSLRLRCASLDVAVSSLSGGNQQKVVLGKWLAKNPKILLLDEPTRGVDVGAKSEIYDQIERLAQGGMGVLLASSDLPELLRLCDRIVVMAKGRVMGEQWGDEATEQSLTALAFGAGQA